MLDECPSLPNVVMRIAIKDVSLGDVLGLVITFFTVSV